MLRPLIFGTSICALTALLGACSGSVPGGSAAGSGSPAGSETNWTSHGVTFDPLRAQTLLSSSEFRFANADCLRVGCGSSGTLAANQSQAYELHNVHFAHSADLTGAGQLVAVVDNGFRLSHQEFSGKTLYQTGALPLADHGTHVASLIAGVKDGAGMHGVAPGAALHLTAINPTGASTLDMANVTAGTLSAAQLGAVAQNNSWGFEVSAASLKTYLDANAGATVAQGLHALLGYGSDNWQTYINALNTFQQGGVVVWALSNSETMTSGDAMAALPYFEPNLREAWIAAANGYFEVDGSGEITLAIRLSAACGLAAKFCMAGDGTTTAASATNDTSYGSGTGTSYVAPQIAGSVAVLAAAFPDLTPAEWTKRLLASADNSWFTALGVSAAGTVDFGNGVSHGYSDEWGHGVLDLKAALSPIGSVSVLSGDTVTTSDRTALNDSAIVTPASFGDGLARSLGGQDMAVFDGLNRSFVVDAGNFVQPQISTMMPRLMDQVAASRNSPPQPTGGVQVHLTSDLDGLFNPAGSRGSSVLSLAGDALALTSTHAVGMLAVTAYGFAGDHNTTAGGAITGGGLNVALPVGNGVVSVGIGQIAEQGGMLGLDSNQAFDFGSGTAISTVNFGIEQELAPSLRVFGRFEYGAATPGGFESGGLVTSADGVRFSGMMLGAALSGVVTNDDQLTLSLGQPMRIEAGTAEMAVPVGRTADGDILHRDVQAELAPSGRQLDMGFSYAMTMQNRASLQFGLQYALDAGHVHNASAFGVAASYGQKF